MEQQTRVDFTTPTNTINHNTASRTHADKGAEDSDSRSSTQDDLSLRFPRPSGSRHLASWVINSDPEIMRVTSVPMPEDGSGLTDSTYEYIYSVDDSNSEWSHDGNMDDNETMGASTSSLGQHCTDDANSVIEASETEAEMFHEGSGMTERPAISSDPADVDSDDDQSSSTPSLDYAHATLDRPSFVEEKPELSESSHNKKQGVFQLLKDYKTTAPSMRSLLENRSVLTGLGVCVLALLGTILTLSSRFMPQQSRNVSNILALPSTSTMPSTSTASQVSSRTATFDNHIPSSTASERNLESQVQDETSSYDWIFGPPRPKITYTFQANKLTAHVPADIKAGWQEQDCVTVQAYRSGQAITTYKGDHKDGFFATIHSAERYGDVEFVLEATCKPVTRRAVYIRFPTFAESLEELKDTVKNYRSLPDVTKALIPVLEHLVNPHILGRQFGEHAWDTAKAARHNLREASSLASTMMNKAVQKLNHAADVQIAGKQATEHLRGQLRRARAGLQLGLLDAQIAAKLSWLGIAGQKNAHEEYRRKAEAYMAEKRTKARQLVQASTNSLK